MPNAQTPVLHYLRRIVSPRDAENGSDAQLLAHFVACGEEAAFTELVRRHGPMVLGVCRRHLHHAHDAEDAFQATFLVFVRKAPTLRRPELLANWLYGVACRVAARARVEAARRRRREGGAMHEPASRPEDDLLWRDLRPLLDAEVLRLPERYRAAFVLCYLEGKTNQQAARELGCPEGTILSRLAWARKRLRGRLTRQGVTLTAGLFAATLTATSASGAVPPPLLSATVRAGLGVAAGQATTGVVSAPIATLTEGVLRAMTMSKLKLTALALLALIVLAWGASLIGRTIRADEPISVQAVVRPAEGELPAINAVIEDAVSVKTLPPVVVRTVPQSGDTQVDAKAVKEIRVTFSKDMEDGTWSWAQLSDDSFPQTSGKPHYDKDHRTCVLPVKLQPGKTYVTWLNSEKFNNFKDASGMSAVPYLLVFQTKP